MWRTNFDMAIVVTTRTLPIDSILVSVCEFTLAADAARLQSVTAPVIRRPLEIIFRASIFSECWSTTQKFNTEQIAWDRMSGRQTKIKHLVYFQH